MSEKLNKTFNKFVPLLKKVINEKVKDKEVCLLLSGGTDSTTLGLTLNKLGKSITTVSFYLDNFESLDCIQSEKTSNYMNWDFHKVKVDTSNPKKDFVRLIQNYPIQTKTNLECLFPMIEVVKKVKELGFNKVIGGFDDPYMSSRNSIIKSIKDNDKFWNDFVNQSYSPSTQLIINLFKENGIELITPYSDKRIKSLFKGLTYKDIHKPYKKYPSKYSFIKEYEELGLLNNKMTPLQKECEEYFQPLIFDKEINYKNYKTSHPKKCLIHLVNLWSKNRKPKFDLSEYNPIIRKYEPYYLKDVYQQSEKKLFNVVSTFSGGGGSSIGYKLSGGHIVCCNEFVKESVETYRRNFPTTPIIDCDIRKINRSGDYVKKFFEQFGVKYKELDILDGSPICSTFSTSNTSKDPNKLTKMKKYSDTQQKRGGYLMFEYVFMVNSLQPKVFVMENVPQIKNSDVFKRCRFNLDKSYITTYQILKSSQYGVPQIRKRLIFVGIRKDVCKELDINEDNINEIYPLPSQYEPTLRDCLEGVVNNEEEVNFLINQTKKSSSYPIIKQLYKQNVKSIKSIYKDWSSDFSIIKTEFDKPSSTVTVVGSSSKGGGLLHPTEKRGFTTDEILRITSLPLDYKFSGNFNQRTERCGRMVPPFLHKNISQSIYEKVLKPYNELTYKKVS